MTAGFVTPVPLNTIVARTCSCLWSTHPEPVFAVTAALPSNLDFGQMDQTSVALSGAGHQNGSWAKGLWSNTDSDREIQWIASKMIQAHMPPAPITQKPINVNPKALFEAGRGPAALVEFGASARSSRGTLEMDSIPRSIFP